MLGGGKQRGGRGGRGGGRGDGGQGRGRGDGGGGGQGRGNAGTWGRGQGGQHQQQQQQVGGQPRTPHQPLPAAPPPAQSAWGAPRQQVPQQQLKQPLVAAPPPAQSAWGQPRPQQQQPQTSKPQQQKTKGPQKVDGDLSQKLAARNISTSAGGAGAGDVGKTKEVIAKGGTKGRRVEVYTNHFAMDFTKLEKLVYMYDVTINPDRPKKQIRRVMEEFKRVHFPRLNPAYDGSKILFSAGRLPFGYEISDTVNVMLDDRVKEYHVVIKKVQEIDMGAIDRFYEQVANHVITDAPNIVLQVIDVVLRHSIALRQIVVGNSLFTIPPANRTIYLGTGADLYRGMHQSVNFGWRPFLNVDVANKAFPSPANIIYLIKEFQRNNVDVSKTLSPYIFEMLRKHLRNLRVQYEIPRNASSRRTYKVNGVESNALDHMFECEGRQINVFNYYQTMKGYTIQYPKMPLLWVGSMNNKVMVPSELCTVLPGQVVHRKCDAQQTRNMIRECATNTDRRQQSVLENVRNANYNADAVVRDFGLRISEQLEKVEARILDPPTIRYKSVSQQVTAGVWRPHHFYATGEIRRGWTVLNLDRGVVVQDVRKLVRQAQRSARALGMNMGAYVAIGRSPDAVRPRRELADLKAIFADVKRRGLDLVFVVLPGYNDRMYACVKLAAEISVGCLTQCIKSATLQQRMTDTTMTNILMKVNAKLAGANHTLHTVPDVMRNHRVMLMGADVTHPSPDVTDGFSVAAVTASHGPSAFEYNVCWRLQQPGQEIILDMEDITKQQLMRFYDRNGQRKPERIIVFRDGVSTGQFAAVLQAELQAIRRACKGLQENYEPRVTFIVVQKRHHTRFFPVDRGISEDRNNNVPAGTIVDRTITHPTRQNFYLVSHASIQGTARPTKYVTLWDDNEISDDSLEELTYHLCHMFSRCTRSVSYPAPTYYAHLAAARGKAYCDGKGRINTGNLQREQDELRVKGCIIEDKPMFFV